MQMKPVLRRPTTTLRYTSSTALPHRAAKVYTFHTPLPQQAGVEGLWTRCSAVSLWAFVPCSFRVGSRNPEIRTWSWRHGVERLIPGRHPGAMLDTSSSHPDGSVLKASVYEKAQMQMSRIGSSVREGADADEQWCSKCTRRRRC
ncbi:hypothetical protein Bbelb_032620 [Branchiostoma belcheri]|nr:hypothetical protein Bbelb_032620 [Branchiostoma belcheri]